MTSHCSIFLVVGLNNIPILIIFRPSALYFSAYPFLCIWLSGLMLPFPSRSLTLNSNIQIKLRSHSNQIKITTFKWWSYRYCSYGVKAYIPFHFHWRDGRMYTNIRYLAETPISLSGSNTISHLYSWEGAILIELMPKYYQSFWDVVSLDLHKIQPDR